MCYPERRGLVSLCGVKAACSGDLCTGNGHRGKNWSLDILSRAFFNGPELTSRISRFAPDQLTQATGESKLPSLAKEGWTRHQVNGPVPLTGADGVVRSTSNHRCLNEPPRLRPLRRLRRFFLMGAATPPLPERGILYYVRAACFVSAGPAEFFLKQARFLLPGLFRTRGSVL